MQPNVEELEREINEAKKAQIESKLKAKAVVNGHVQEVAGSQDVTPELDKRTPQSDDDKIRSTANGWDSDSTIELKKFLDSDFIICVAFFVVLVVRSSFIHVLFIFPAKSLIILDIRRKVPPRGVERAVEAVVERRSPK